MFLKSILTCVLTSTVSARAKNFASQGGSRRKYTFLKIGGNMNEFSACGQNLINVQLCVRNIKNWRQCENKKKA